MKTRFMRTIVAIIAIVASAFPSLAHDFEVDGIYYNITSKTDKTVAVTYKGNNFYDFDEYSGEIIIPESIIYSGKTYNVTSISYQAFDDCTGLTSVAIPKTVTSIGSSAFYDCAGLKSVTIPNSVTSISSSSFYGCTALTSVTIPNSITSIGDYAFSGCTGLTSVTIPESVISISTLAFSGCTGLKSVSIGASVTSIGDSAFSGCSGLTSVIIPESVISISTLAFSGCTGLTSVSIGDSVTSIGGSAFSGCTGLTAITIPASVTSIGDSAFFGCTGLTVVSIGGSVTLIGDSAFSGCSRLTSVTIPSSVTSIGNSAFSGCTGLTVVSIGDSVTSIGDSAFSGCSGLTSVTIPSSVTLIGDSAFSGCTGLTSASIGTSVTLIGDSAFSECTGLTSVSIGTSVTSIGNFAFRGCTGLEDVYISDIAAWCNMEIKSNPLDYAKNLYLNGDLITDLLIPDTVTEIKAGRFKNCESLTSVTIPTSVTSIGGSAFYECNNLKYVYYDAKNVSSAGSDIFPYYYYNKIGHIVIGTEVVSIPKGIFNNCHNVRTLVSKNPTPPVCDAEAFGSIDKSRCILYVPAESYIDYWNADVWKDFASIKPLTQTKSVSFIDESIAIKPDEYLQLEATITPAEAIQNLIWTSSNPEIATVSDTGVVHGVVPGETIITAMAGDGTNLKASCKVTVETVRAESITLNHDMVQLQPYESIVLSYTILPYNTTDKSVTWTSSDPSVATLKVNNDGSATVLMLKKGTVTITAVTNDGSNLSASCIVSDEVKAKSITLSQAEVLLAPDESISLTYTILPENTTNKGVTWASSDPSVVKVNVNDDGSATVIRLNEGTVTITATTNDGSNLSASCIIEDRIKAESITLNQAEALLSPDESILLTCTILPENTTNKSVTWTSSDPSVAKVNVNDDGSATVLKLTEGNATITVTTNDGSNLSASCLIVGTDGALILDSTELILAKNEWTTLKARVFPDDIEVGGVIWSVDNSKVIRLIDNGDNSAMLLALSDGKATVTATATTADSKILTAKCLVSVTSAGVEGIESDVCTVTVENGAIVVKNAVGAVTVHNLTGVAVASEQADGDTLRIDCLQHGVYIVTVNGKATKVVL